MYLLKVELCESEKRCPQTPTKIVSTRQWSQGNEWGERRYKLCDAHAADMIEASRRGEIEVIGVTSYTPPSDVTIP